MSYSPIFKELIELYKSTDIEFNDLKDITLAMWILESGRGYSKLATEHLNFSGMKYRTEISDLSKRILYEAHDGRAYYCEFESLDNFIKGFWLFLDREPYNGWKVFGDNPIEFIRFIGNIWAEDTNYADKVINLLDEAMRLLDISDSSGEEEDYGIATMISGRPHIQLSENGKIAISNNGLNIEYRGSDQCPYGKSATKNKKDFSYIVIHGNDRKHDTEWLIQYQIDGDPGREGHFGYHFYIDPNGTIYQGAPLTKRTNQVKSSSKIRKNLGRKAYNTNSIGISCTDTMYSQGYHPTDEQIKSMYDLVYALCNHFDIPFAHVFGHGEIQADRQKVEGTSLASEIRSWND